MLPRPWRSASATGGENDTEIIFLIYKLPTQDRQDFKLLNLWNGSVLNMKKILILTILVGVMFLTGCAQKIGVTKIGIRERYRQLTKNIFDTQYPSESTIMFLVQNDLLDDWQDDSILTLKKIADAIAQNPDRAAIFALSELCFYEAEEMDELSKESIPLYLSATIYSYKYLFGNWADQLSPYHPNSRLACEIYNRSLAGFLTYIEVNKIKIKDNTKFPLLNGEIEIEQKISKFSWILNDFDEIKVVYQYKVQGVDYQFRTYGVGVPIIATKCGSKVSREDKFTPILNQTHAATVFLKVKSKFFSSNHSNILYKADIEIYDPISTETIIIEDKTAPLETDFTTPLAYMIGQDTSSGGFKAMLKVDVWKNFQGLYLLQPYQHDKIPVVFIHGLMSEPKTWLKILNSLKSDPVLRKKYQFWFFKYPTGNPILFSAANLRQSLINVRNVYDPDENDADFDKMVLVAHSMGGLLSRFMIQDSSNTLWNIIANNPLEEYEIKSSTSNLFERMFFFDSLPFVSRVIFISTPHRGSTMAQSWYSRFGAFITRLTSELTDSASDFAKVINLKDKDDDKEKLRYKLKRMPTGLDSLLPDNPMLKAMIKQPFSPNVTYHSIIGNKKEANVKGGTDGIVTYESAHIDGAKSEKIILSDHGVHTKSQGIIEVRRILTEHIEN